MVSANRNSDSMAKQKFLMDGLPLNKDQNRQGSGDRYLKTAAWSVRPKLTGHHRSDLSSGTASSPGSVKNDDGVVDG